MGAEEEARRIRLIPCPAEPYTQVPGVGIEPTWDFSRGILSPLRLPFRHPATRRIDPERWFGPSPPSSAMVRPEPTRHVLPLKSDPLRSFERRSDPRCPAPVNDEPRAFQKLARALRRRQPDLTVLMERVHKSHNLSAILRNCDAVGVLEAHAIPPEEGLQIHSHTSAGTAKWVRLVRHHTIQAASKELKGGGFRVLAAHPGPDAVDFREVDFTMPPP